MTDNITLPRAEAEQIRQALVSGKRLYAALFALDAALAEPESDAQCPTCGGGLDRIAVALRMAYALVEEGSVAHGYFRKEEVK